MLLTAKVLLIRHKKTRQSRYTKMFWLC